MSVNLSKLDQELNAAGIPIDGVGKHHDGTLRIDFKPEATAPQCSRAAEILAAHDPSPTLEQRLRDAGIDKLRAALVLRLSSGWTALTPPSRLWVQRVIDERAVEINAALA